MARLIDANEIAYYTDEQGFECAYKVDIDNLLTIDPESRRSNMISVKEELPPSSKVVMAYDLRGVLYLECCYLESANGWYDVRRHKPIHYGITYWMNYPKYPEN